MKKVNLKLLNIAFWLEILLAYLMPFQKIDAAQVRVGFPFAFLSIYDAPLSVNPLMSMHLNPLPFCLNALLLYLALSLGASILSRTFRVPRKSPPVGG